MAKYPIELTAAQRRRGQQVKKPNLVCCYRLTGPGQWVQSPNIHGGAVTIKGGPRGVNVAKTLFIA